MRNKQIPCDISTIFFTKVFTPSMVDEDMKECNNSLYFFICFPSLYNVLYLNMKIFQKQTFIFLLLLILISSLSLFGGDFDSIKVKNGVNESLTFPTDFLSDTYTIFAFVLSSSREGGETQQQQLLSWHTRLTEHENFPKNIKIYHLPVIKNPPGFVKGFIRRGLANTYKETVEEKMVAVLFVKDSEKFASKATLPFEDEAVVAVVDPFGKVTGFVQGEVTDEKVETLLSYLLR